MHNNFGFIAKKDTSDNMKWMPFHRQKSDIYYFYIGIFCYNKIR